MPSRIFIRLGNSSCSSATRSISVEIEKLKIQDGLPVLAEVSKKKVKFGA